MSSKLKLSQNNISEKITDNQNQNILTFKLNEDQAELILLHNIIINHILLMINNKTPKKIIKEKIIDLYKKIRHHNKFISKDVSDSKLETFFNLQYKKTKEIKKTIDVYILRNKKNNIKYEIPKNISKTKKKIKYTSRHTSRHKGGFYFKSLEEKGDQPLTGTDLATLLDEMQQFFYNAQYTDEGKFLQDTNTVISMLRGDTQQFKGILQYRIFPKYYTVYPPFLKFAAIKKDLIDNKKWEDIPDYLLAYQSYLRSQDEYLVDKGLKSPDVLNKDLYNGFFNKVANSLDQNIQKFQQYRNKSQGKFFPIALPT
jgi:hypothetical protein